MDTRGPTVKSFSDGTRELPVNYRLNAAERADAKKHITAMSPGIDRSGLGAILAQYYGRDKLPDPQILARINTNSLRPQAHEIADAMGKNLTLPEQRQEAIYRIMLADLGLVMRFPNNTVMNQRARAE